MARAVLWLWLLLNVPTSGALAEEPQSLGPTYMGFRLGETQSEVMYKLGYPPNVIGAEPLGDWPGYPVYDTSRNDPKNAMPAGTSIEDYLEWSYPQGERRIDLRFSAQSQRLESVTCYSASFQNCPTLYGVRLGQSDTEVVEALGSPSRSSITGVAKILEYPALGLTLTLAKGRVYMMKLSEIQRNCG